jgi:hypothetical protein
MSYKTTHSDAMFTSDNPALCSLSDVKRFLPASIGPRNKQWLQVDSADILPSRR